jgi:hypothetical protein
MRAPQKGGKASRRDKNSHITHSLVVNKNLNPMREELNLLEDGLSKENNGHQLSFIILLDGASEYRRVLPRGRASSKNAKARVPQSSHCGVRGTSISGKLDLPFLVLENLNRVRNPGR